MRDYGKHKEADQANGLARLSAVLVSSAIDNKVRFLNELELLAHAYGLIFRRMCGLEWGEEPEFLSLQELAHTYLQTLKKNSLKKYDFGRNGIKNTSQLYTVLLDDLVTLTFERVHRHHLITSIHRIKEFIRLGGHNMDHGGAKKLEKLSKLLTRFNEKDAKKRLLDLLKNVNTVRPREGLLYKLMDLFDYYSTLYKQDGLNRIKILTQKQSNEEIRKKEGLERLKDLFEKKKTQTYHSLPYRTMFPMSGGESTSEAHNRMTNVIHKVYKNKLADGFYRIRSAPLNFVIEGQPNEERNLENRKTMIRKITERQALPLIDSLNKLVFSNLAYSMRRILKKSVKRENHRDRVLIGLTNLFLKRKLAGFNQIKHFATELKVQRMIALREGLSNLDSFYKNKLNEAFSQIKVIMIELQILSVSDVTNMNKIMFSVKDILNTSGNLSGNWGDVQGLGSQRLIQNASRVLPRDMSPGTSGTRFSMNNKETINTSINAGQQVGAKKSSERIIQTNQQHRDAGNTSTYSRGAVNDSHSAATRNNVPRNKSRSTSRSRAQNTNTSINRGSSQNRVNITTTKTVNSNAQQVQEIQRPSVRGEGVQRPSAPASQNQYQTSSTQKQTTSNQQQTSSSANTTKITTKRTIVEDNSRRERSPAGFAPPASANYRTANGGNRGNLDRQTDSSLEEEYVSNHMGQGSDQNMASQGGYKTSKVTSNYTYSSAQNHGGRSNAAGTLNRGYSEHREEDEELEDAGTIVRRKLIKIETSGGGVEEHQLDMGLDKVRSISPIQIASKNSRRIMTEQTSSTQQQFSRTNTGGESVQNQSRSGMGAETSKTTKKTIVTSKYN